VTIAEQARRAEAPAGAEPVYALDAAAVAAALGVDPDAGLAEAEAAERLAEYGPNRLPRRERPHYLRIASAQFTDPLVALLVAAAAVSWTVGDGIEAAAIAAIVVLNASLGFFQEVEAERAVLSLAASLSPTAVVVRGGLRRELPADQVVPGDVLVVREGDRVVADARVVRAHGLEVDESALTGESLPLEKGDEPVAADTPLAERRSMVHAGSAATRGRARAVVVATGVATELGRIESLAAESAPPPTPLQRRLGGLARQMVLVGAAITVVLAAAMLARGSSLHESFLVGVAVAVAAVPEGLAATVTIALAFGARAMAARGAIVQRLDAIETIGEATVICTDKTGTLTENKIRVAALRPARGVDERELLAAAVLASTADVVARPDGPLVLGDPIEGALVLAALERGIGRDELLAARRAVHELPFDPVRKRMTIVYDDADGRRAFVKGAPEALLACAREGDPELARAAAGWAEEGFRVLAVGDRRLAPDAMLGADVETSVRLLGLVALHDPLRETAPDAIARACGAGIEVRMVTGDHPATARTLAHALGLADDHVHARTTPADKLRLVEELQERGDVVAVTGDGVNDAPALRRADVGVAMGRSGTEAAREAAAIVLTDDDFSTIVAAIREGRRISDNVRKIVAFLLSANLGEVLLFAVAIAVGASAPLVVIQVLVVNLVTDGLPAVALARDPSSGDTMTPRPQLGPHLFDARSWAALAAIGGVVGAIALAAYAAGTAFGGGVAQTMTFATIALGELGLAFAMRAPRTAAWRLPRNSWLLATTAGSALLVAAAVYAPGLHDALDTVALAPAEACVVVALALVPFVAVEAAKAARRRIRRS
jgi:Ca2+-transporting ATPase